MDNGGHMPSQSQWAKLNEFLLQVGSFDDPIAFCVNAIRRLRNVVSFDEGRVYFMDSDGQVFDEYLLGVSKKVTKAYHEYYGELGGRRYSATKRAKDEEQRLRLNDANDETPKGMRVKRQRIVVMDWSKEPHDTRFYREYVAPLGLTFSTGFQLFDVDGNTRALFCLDRTRPVDYSSDERALLSLVATHLDNMYRKLFCVPPVSQGDTIGLMASGVELTERERQVCTMLMRGASTKSIAKMFGISRTTVYKHVSNIHRKLGVSSQGELLARLSAAAIQGRGDTIGTQP